MSRRPKAQKVTNTYQEADLGSRVGYWLRLTYHGSRAKKISHDFGVSEATAKRWLAGIRPTSEMLSVMAQRWGWRFVNFAFEPVVGTPAMYAEMQAFDARLARLETEREAEDARGALAIAGIGTADGGARASLGGADEEEAASVAPRAGGIRR